MANPNLYRISNFGIKNMWCVFLVSVMLFVSSLLNFITTYNTVSVCMTMDVTPRISQFGRLTSSSHSKLTSFFHRTMKEPFEQYSNALDCSLIKDQIIRYVCEVEAFSVFYSSHPHPTVVAKDLSILRYYAQRDLQGLTLAYKNISFDVFEHSFRQAVKLSDLSVLLCLGIVSQDKHCLKPSSYKTLSQGHRVNQIHLLRDILWRKDAFCYTLREAVRGYKGWSNFTFPCWVLPDDIDSLEKQMTLSKGNYIVKPAFRGEGHGIFVVDSFEEINRPTIENYVIQPFLSNPLLVKSKKFDFRTYVLVTSIIPPRIYIYKDGLVRFAARKYDHNVTKGGTQQQYLTNTSVGKKYTQLANLTWTYNRLAVYLEKKKINATKVFDSVHNAITRTILASEFRFLSDSKFNLGGYDCRHCFQLLGVDVILDSNLHPIVIEVNGLPSMQLSHEMGVVPNPSSVYTVTKYGLMKDMLHIIYGNISVSKEVANSLRLLKIGIGPGAFCNSSLHIHCIDMKTLQQIISLKREHYLKGGYIKLYPVENGDRYARFIEHMNGIIKKKLDIQIDDSVRTLWQVHHLFTALEKLKSLVEN